MVYFLFIRHGESRDNLRSVWAGWKDSPLSNHGMRQAEALADDLSGTKLSAIYCSDLLRAKRTAEALKERQTNSTTLLFQESILLREQNFGAGEGMKFCKKEKGLTLAAHYAKGLYPALYTRQERFPGGESLDEMAQRADTVIDDILLQHVVKDAKEGPPLTIAIVSHGLFIGELIAAIVKKDVDFRSEIDVRNLRGMKNTAWTKLEVTPKSKTIANKLSVHTSIPLNVKVLGMNRHAHLSNLHRQKGGIGNLAHDPSQRDIRAFLGGKSTAKAPRPKPY